jgi:hypothetical protein
VSDEDLTYDMSIGIRSSCPDCAWKSSSYPYGEFGDQQAADELSRHQIEDHPRDSEGVRLGVYIDE